MSRYHVDYRGRPIDLTITGDELALSLDGIVRKRRARTGGESVYVWTNIELHWEEHHFIEGRWWPASGRVELTVNGTLLLEATHRD